MALLLMIAGWETSSILITNAIWLLAQHPEQRSGASRENPGAIPAAVEEVLRFDAPVQHLARLTLEDATLHGQTIPEGSRVLLLWASANRDERRWDEPDRFDIGREPKRNLAFGEGIHHCLGAPLARLESRGCLETLLARGVEFEVGEPGAPAPGDHPRDLRAADPVQLAARGDELLDGEVEVLDAVLGRHLGADRGRPRAARPGTRRRRRRRPGRPAPAAMRAASVASPIMIGTIGWSPSSTSNPSSVIRRRK